MTKSVDSGTSGLLVMIQATYKDFDVCKPAPSRPSWVSLGSDLMRFTELDRMAARAEACQLRTESTDVRVISGNLPLVGSTGFR